MFRKFLQNLDVTVVLYNHINETILDVEYPLIEGKLRSINEQLEKAISQLNWTSDGTLDSLQSICYHASDAKFVFCIVSICV